jgi:hypothetical protein
LAIDSSYLTTGTKLKLLSGEPIKVNNVGEIKPLTLRQISKIGYETYLEHLNIFAISKKDLIKEEHLDEVEIPFFNLLLAFADNEFKLFLEDAFSTFLGTSVRVVQENLMIIADNPKDKMAITSDNFDDLRQVIHWQNGIGGESSDDNIKFKNDRAKRTLEKLRKAQAEVQKQKKKENDDLDFADIISAIASKSFSLNKLNVWDLTVYQMYDEFRRLDLIDSYEVGTRAMIAGAKNVQLKHWTNKITN